MSNFPGGSDDPEIRRWRHGDTALTCRIACLSRHSPAELAQSSWLFPRATQLLVIPRYRKELLRGLVLSLGSKTEMAVSLGNEDSCHHTC